MDKASILKFVNAVKTANITKWEAITDVSTHLYNNDVQFNIIDEDTESLYNFAISVASGSPHTGDIVAKATHFGDIHECRLSGNIKEIRAFINALGKTLTPEQEKILVNIQGANYNIKPVTGDYTFRELSQKEIDRLSPEQKSKYEQELDAYKKSKNSIQRPIQITI